MIEELKKELFNIYDVIVFEDENGITQDCVCVIGKNKERDKIVYTVECNNHDISIYDNGSYKVWERNGKGMPYYATNKKIIHLYTLKNDNRYYEIYPTNNYESIDNANPSEAMECLDKLEECAEGMKDLPLSNWIDLAENEAELDLKIMDWVETIKFELFKGKQALLKAQEPKKYVDELKLVEKKLKALEIIKEKECDMRWLKFCIKGNAEVETYNNGLSAYYEKLTEEEFNLLREVLE